MNTWRLIVLFSIICVCLKYFTIKSLREIIRLASAVFSGGDNCTHVLCRQWVLHGGDASPEPFSSSRMPATLAVAPAIWRPEELEKLCHRGFILQVTSAQRPRCSFLCLPRKAQTAFFYFPLYCHSMKSWGLGSDELVFNSSFANRGCKTLFCNCLTMVSLPVTCRR